MSRVLIAALSLLGVYIIWRVLVMRAKAGVDLTGVSWRMFVASLLIEPIFATFGAELVITSGVDGKHGDGSLHYQGLALDYRTSNLAGYATMAYAKVRALLKPLGYDVVLESDHMHVEYDPA